MQAQNKPINDICNIKLGKKYLFKTVQSPSTQSEHINRYSFGFSSFGLWLLGTEKSEKQRVICAACFGRKTVHSLLQRSSSGWFHPLYLIWYVQGCLHQVRHRHPFIYHLIPNKNGKQLTNFVINQKNYGTLSCHMIGTVAR